MVEVVAGVVALFRLARRAREAAQSKLPSAWRIHVLANNSDGLGSSWGSHLNFLISRSAYDRIFNRRLHHLVWLATYQASSIVFTGQGKVDGAGRRSTSSYPSARTSSNRCLVGRPPIGDRSSIRATKRSAANGRRIREE